MCHYYSVVYVCPWMLLHRACILLAISGFWYGLSRPSPSPMYKGQNDLPVGWSGQLPFVCICMTLNAAGLRIANYIRFWKERRESSQASAVILGNADADTVQAIKQNL